MVDVMDRILQTVADTNGGYLSRAQVLDCGYRDSDIQSAVRTGLWVRLRRGYFAETERWNSLSPEDQHVLVLRTILDLYGDVIAFSHHSSCAAHGFALHNQDLTTSHLTRLDNGATRREAGIVHHRLPIDPDRDIEIVRGLPVTRTARGLWESGLNTDVEGALVTLNDALHAKAVSLDDLASTGSTFEHWARSRRVRLALRLTDDRVESPGETRALYLCWEFGIARPELQYEVFGADGQLIGRTDFAWLKHRHLGEFDGMVKYRRSWRPGEDPGQVVEREKLREDRLRGEKFGMTRIIAADYHGGRRRQTADRIKHGLEQSNRLFARGRVVIPLS